MRRGRSQKHTSTSCIHPAAPTGAATPPAMQGLLTSPPCQVTRPPPKLAPGVDLSPAGYISSLAAKGLCSIASLMLRVIRRGSVSWQAFHFVIEGFIELLYYGAGSSSQMPVPLKVNWIYLIEVAISDRGSCRAKG